MKLTKDDINGMPRSKALELFADFPAVLSDFVCADGTRLNSIVLVLLPRELWRDADGCCCRYCSKEPRKSGPAFWDTVALSYDERVHYVWTVHAPELHGAKPKRSV